MWPNWATRLIVAILGGGIVGGINGDTGCGQAARSTSSVELLGCGLCVAWLAAPKWERAAACDVMARDCLAARHRRVLTAQGARPVHLPSIFLPTPNSTSITSRGWCIGDIPGKMPADIRSFFGGGAKASQGSQSSQKKDEVCSASLRLAAAARLQPRTDRQS